MSLRLVSFRLPAPCFFPHRWLSFLSFFLTAAVGRLPFIPHGADTQEEAVRTHLRKNRFRQDNLPSVPCWTPVCRNPLDWKRLTVKIQAWNACKWMEFPVMICN